MTPDVIESLQEARRLLWGQWAALDRAPKANTEAVDRARSLAEAFDRHLADHGVPR